MPSFVSFQQQAQQYLVKSPEGTQIEIPKELYDALREFVQETKAMASVVIQFRNGGIAGLEALVKKTYK
jgi:hypothetical protein